MSHDGAYPRPKTSLFFTWYDQSLIMEAYLPNVRWHLQRRSIWGNWCWSWWGVGGVRWTLSRVGRRGGSSVGGASNIPLGHSPLPRQSLPELRWSFCTSMCSIEECCWFIFIAAIWRQKYVFDDENVLPVNLTLFSFHMESKRAGINWMFSYVLIVFLIHQLIIPLLPKLPEVHGRRQRRWQCWGSLGQGSSHLRGKVLHTS